MYSLNFDSKASLKPAPAQKIKQTATNPLLISIRLNMRLSLYPSGRNAFTTCVSIIQIQANPLSISIKFSLCNITLFLLYF